LHWSCPLALTPTLSRREGEPIGVSLDLHCHTQNVQTLEISSLSRREKEPIGMSLDFHCHTQNVQTLEISSLSWGRGLG